MGDEVIHKVDIVSESGSGKVLNKIIEFDIMEDIIYFNSAVFLSYNSHS